jgi:hypothetical protein
VAHFDNSSRNLNNPDPDAEVEWGDQTWNEMMIGYFDIAVPLEGLKAVAGAPRAGGGDDRRAAVRADQALEQFDKNDDGRIAADEVPARLKPLFRRLDADDNGSLDRKELTLRRIASQRSRSGLVR